MEYEILVSAVQKNTIWTGAMDLTSKSNIGFTREQLAKHINFDVSVVNYWIKRLIDSEDILVDTAGMLSVDPDYLK